MSMIDQILGVSPQVLSIRSRKSELIAANLANADTPGYKSRDIDFGQAMVRAKSAQSGLTKTHSMHMETAAMANSVGYRVPVQPSLDGNTVETDREHAEFMDNAIRYQASLNFMEGRIKSVLLALRGE
ncbi:MAG: flagellar basal body rod protein FlgB [Porticoccaceae bacterium]|nr:flagellar basal body rod protein FlgB [Pseudomonadales bacterium]MCP5173006.1 flagellar basal body rod protein FlgB [Pseudomonadales bacterium]MCP5302479.1 flagellar basal body rod protein FlgB [Pseudomonadales bacterium]